MMNFLICRICLDKRGSISFFQNNPDDVQYSVIFNKLVNIVVTEDDALPTLMCESCTSELLFSYRFIQKCESSERTLRYTSTPLDLYSDLNLDSFEEIKTPDITNEIDDIYTSEVLNSLCGNNTSTCLDNEPSISRINEENGVLCSYDNNPDQKKTCNYQVSNTNTIASEDFRSDLHKKKVKSKNVRNITCRVCSHMASSRSAMKIHMRTHTGEKPFVCTTCDARYPTKASLKRHYDTHQSTRERKFTCDTCGSSFYRKRDIIIHLRVHTGERPYVCCYCSKRFRQDSSRNRHQRVHTGAKPFSCPICNKNFAYKSLVQIHQNVHSNERRYKCYLCSKSMKSETALNVHIGLHTKDKQYTCSFCGVAFAIKGNLQSHIRRMHSEKSGQCATCLKTFSDLQGHMRKHTGEKPYICSLCSAAFHFKRSLTHHKSFKHKNTLKFKCSNGDCNKSFPTASMFEFHYLKQHSEHTPYVCPHCSRNFFRASDLSRHVKSQNCNSKLLPNNVKTD